MNAVLPLEAAWLLQHMEYINVPSVLCLCPCLASMHNFGPGISFTGSLGVLDELALGPFVLTRLESPLVP
jgi:hypothetical protein